MVFHTYVSLPEGNMNGYLTISSYVRIWNHGYHWHGFANTCVYLVIMEREENSPKTMFLCLIA